MMGKARGEEGKKKKCRHELAKNISIDSNSLSGNTISDVFLVAECLILLPLPDANVVDINQPSKVSHGQGGCKINTMTDNISPWMDEVSTKLLKSSSMCTES